jgi:hypothetical protein
VKILVCGGRNYGRLDNIDRNHDDWPKREAEYRHVMRELDKLAIEHSSFYDPNDNWLPVDIEIIQGGATGADKSAYDWAVVNFAQCREYPADWGKHGNAAGPIRNQQMLDKEKPDLVLAFPGGYGTQDMLKRAERGGYTIKLAYGEETGK